MQNFTQYENGVPPSHRILKNVVLYPLLNTGGQKCMKRKLVVAVSSLIGVRFIQCLTNVLLKPVVVCKNKQTNKQTNKQRNKQTKQDIKQTNTHTTTNKTETKHSSYVIT